MGGGARRENKRYTSITNDDEDDEVISRGNFTNEADDLENTDENPNTSTIEGGVGTGTTGLG